MSSTPRWLDILIRARQADEDVAARKLADAQRSVTQAIELAEREAARASSLMRPSAPMTVAQFLAGAQLAQATAASASVAVQRIAICEQDVARERANVISASRSRRISENLRERKRSAAEAESLRKQQVAQDDLANIRSARLAKEKIAG